MKDNWIGHILLRKCLLKYVFKRKIEGRIKVTRRRGKDVSSYLITLKKVEGTGN